MATETNTEAFVYFKEVDVFVKFAVTHVRIPFVTSIE